MATVTRSRKLGKSQSVSLSAPLHGVRALVITKDGASQGYALREIGVDWGRGFELRKIAAEGKTADLYQVHLDNELGHSCTCHGGCYVGRCKHVSALAKLVQLGKL